MKKFLSLVLALVMTASLVTVSAGAKEFKDDKDVTYDEAVAVISEIGVVDGDTDGNFRPTDNLSRGAAAKIICNLILGPTTAAELKADTAPYKDVPVSNVFSGYIAYCAKEGIISGYADGSFRPAGTLTGYAFMKMLLGALGYDGSYEGYTGANWSINVAKQAIGIGLNKGLTEEFNGVDFVTREEAALYSFNTLKATMVDYDQKITTNVNGVDVTISQGSAKPVTWTEGINEDGNIKDDDFVQFAEEFFPKLVRKGDHTKFMEPANTWVYDKTDIGTYERTDLLVETYTSEVTGKDLYDLLKSGVIKDNDLEVYLDGVAATGDNLFDEDDLARSNTKKLGATGNGVVTKVYLDTDDEVITVASINTWLAKATADYSESKEYAPLTVYTDVAKSKPYNVDVEEVSNVVDVTKDTFYQVNISYKDNKSNGEIVVLKDVEILEDSTVTKFSTDKTTVTKLTVGGEEYKGNVKAFYDKDILNKYNDGLLTDNTYNIYVDANGYFLGVDLFEGTKNYVFVTGFDRNTSNLSVKTATASAIFLDGTMKNIQVNVTATDKNIGKASGDNADYFVKWSETNPTTWTAAGKQYDDGVYNLNQWYTYTETDGVYTLKPCARMTWTKYTNPDQEVSIRTDKLSLNDSEGNLARVYNEDETVYLTVDLDVVDTTAGSKKAITEVTGVYTGVQNVDIDVTVDVAEARAEGQVYTVYDSDGYVVAAVVIGEARGATANYAYIVSETKSEGREDGVYEWTFDAVLNGQKQTLTAKGKHETMDLVDANVGSIVELRFDGDYVVAVKEVDKVYRDFTQKNVEDYDAYVMERSGANDTPDTLVLSNHTLRVRNDRKDVGLYIAPEAKAVTIQTENKEKDVVTNFDDVSAAIAHLADANKTTADFDYNGKIYAALNENGDATWLVFVNDAELTTGDDKPGSQKGNLETLKKDAYKLDLNSDGTNDLDLAGSYATGELAVEEYGMVRVNVNYTAPQWVPDGATVTLNIPILYNGVSVGTANPTAVVENGKATLSWNSTPFQFAGYTNHKLFSLGKVAVENFSDVKVFWFDQNAARLEGTLVDETTTVTTNAAGQTNVGAKLVNSDAANSVTINWTNATAKSGTLDATVNFSAFNTGWKETDPIYATSQNGPVVIKLDLSARADSYSVTNLDGTKTLGELYAGTPAAFKNLKLTTTTNRDSSIEPNGAVKVDSMELDNAVPATSKVGLKVTLSTGAVAIFKNDGAATTGAIVAGTDRFTVSGDTAITVAKVEEVAAPTITAVEYTDVDADGAWSVGDTIKVTYSEKVDTSAPTLTFSGTTTATPSFTGNAATYTLATAAPAAASTLKISAITSDVTGVKNIQVYTITFGSTVVGTSTTPVLADS